MTDQPKQLTPPSKETPRQREAFLAYFNLQDRSLEKLRQAYAKLIPKRVISVPTLKSWSKRFKWQERISAMDTEVQSKTEEIAIREATVKKSDILKAVKNTMIKYNQAILAGDIIPNAHDFYRMWELQRKELGKDTEAPSAIKIEINQRILSIVKKAEDEALEVIKEEIRSEQNS